MARIRSLKPEFWHDRKLARSCSRDARMLYMGLWNQADEHSRLNGDESVIKGQVFPFDEDIKIGPLLEELIAAGRVQRYWFDSDPYLLLPKLPKHQRLEPAKAQSRLPDPPDPDDTPDPPRSKAHSEKTAAEAEPIAAEPETSVASLCGMEQVAGGMEHGERAERGADKPAPNRGTRLPEPFEITERMREWAALKTPGVDVFDELEQFLDHHRGKGTTSKDWPASWRLWMRNARKWSNSRQQQNPLQQKRAQAFSVIHNTSPLREIS